MDGDVSLVTNVLLIVDNELRDESVLYAKIPGQSYSEKQQFKKIDLEAAGGYKYMECEVYACAFNYLEESQLEHWFRELVLDDGDEIMMVLNYQNGGFRVISRDVDGVRELS